jgi:hypothetical protein
VRPKQKHSENIGPKWTPDVWKHGADGLRNREKNQLFLDQRDFNNVLAGSDRTMSGVRSSDQNESDQIIQPTSAGHAEAWDDTVNGLRDTEPLAGWSTGDKTGEANPPV